MQNTNLPNLNNTNNYLIDPMADAYRSVYNTPVYQPQIQNPQALPQQQYTPSQELLDYIESLKTKETPEAQKLRDKWYGQDVNIDGHPILSAAATIGRNAIMDIPQIGTGFVNLAGEIITDPTGSFNRAREGATDYLIDLYNRSEDIPSMGRGLDRANLPLRAASYGYNIGKDAWNFLAGTLPVLNTKTIGQAINDIKRGDGNAAYDKLKQAGVDSWDRFKEDPLIISSILAPNLTTNAIVKTGKTALDTAERLGVPVGEVSQKAARAIQAVEAKFNKDKTNLQNLADDLTKAKSDDLELVIRNYTEGTELPESLKPLKDKFSKFQDAYRLTYDDNALVNPNELAALQYVQRKTGKTMQDIRRELTPQLETLQEGVTEKSLASKNRLADLESDVNKVRKDTANKEFLNDNKLVNELTDNEYNTFTKHFDPTEINMMAATRMSVKEAKQYLGDTMRDAWAPSKVSEAALKDIAFKENLEKLASRAEATGDPMLKHLYDGIKLANEGKIGSYTLAGAEIPEKGIISQEGRRLQGRSSSREYGTASYESIAKAYRDVHGFIDDVTTQRVKQQIADNILNTGTIDGALEIVGSKVAPKDMRYLNPELLAEGKLSEALSRASETPVEGAVAIDKFNVNALKSLFTPQGVPFKNGILGDVYNLFKESALASGAYLGGNFSSGLMGAMMNSGTPAGFLNDVIASAGSKGRLAKELGTYRRIRPSDRKYTTGFAKGLSAVGRKLGTGVAPRIDAAMQNMFSEINANARLRQMGIGQGNRIAALNDMSKTKLAQLIEDVRLDSMMNNKFRIIPRGNARDVLGIANPFIDWIDTSTQVSAKMLKEHPVLMGAVASKLFGEIGFNNELQKRLGLKVYTDKPLVTYIPDKDSPSGAKEVTLNFVPQLTPIEFLVNPAKLVTGTSGAPVLTAIYEASKGKSPYGSFMRRSHAKDTMMSIQGNQRYIVNPETRNIEPIEGTMGDEMLATAIRNIVAPVNLINKTVMPVGTAAYNALTGSDKTWYMPYGQSIFGSYSNESPEMATGPLQSILTKNFLTTGDPRKARTMEDVLKGLGTYYSRDYYPTGISANRMRQIKRAGARQNIMDYGE